MLFCSGDLHGDVDIARIKDTAWPIGQQLTRDDYLVILGDFGLNACRNWQHYEYAEWFSWLNKQPWTTLFLDGNHDNFDWLFSLPTLSMFGGKVGRANDNIYYLKRGQVYQIGRSTFFTMGGATSIDRNMRTRGVDWWPEEIPATSDWNEGLKNLERYNFKVDNVLAHTMPIEVARKFIHDDCKLPEWMLYESECIVETAFQHFIENFVFDNWYCGHWHPSQRWDWEKYHCFYNHIEQIDIYPEDIGRNL